MTKYFYIFILISYSILAQVPFHKGVNFTKWFQASSPQQIVFTKFVKEDFENIILLGCDVVRLPINLHGMTDGSPDYNLDPLFLSHLDKVVDWTEELNIHLILDNHSFDPSGATDPNIGEILIPVWKNMAKHFKDRSNLIYYEIRNEPHDIASDTWNSIQQEVVSSIREVDSVHTIIIGPTSWNSYKDLELMPVYEDTNLIYTFHFYDPFLFTHQGASWITPSMAPLAGVPFPYSLSEMPQLPYGLEGTWINDIYNDYENDGTASKIKELIDIAVTFKEERNVPIFCGEFGVYYRNSDDTDRVAWYKVVSDYFDEKNIPWTMWDYKGGFGLFNKGSNELFESDLNIPLIKALGLNEIDQNKFEITPEVDPFPIYLDYIEQGITNSSWGPNASLNFYSTNEPNNGEYCIEWSNAKRYNFIGFDFKPNKNLINFSDSTSGISLSMKIKGDTPNTKLEVRFIDTKTNNPTDHPWRMGYTIEEGIDINWDGTWQEIVIPLSNFIDLGSWDNNTWYYPAGKFDWSIVDEFAIVAEFQDLYGIKFWFDDIEIVDNTVSVSDKYNSVSFNLEQNYPNPFNPSTTIKYSIPQDVKGDGLNLSKLDVRLVVYDVLGREVATLVNKFQNAGSYEVVFNANSTKEKLTSGIYFYRLTSGKFVATKKLLLLK